MCTKDIYSNVKKDIKAAIKHLPVYCFNPTFSYKTGRLMFSIPIQMRLDAKKFNTVMDELETLVIEKLDYQEYGGGTGFDGFYDLDFGPADIKVWAKKYNVPVPENIYDYDF